jgi:Spy/CpxP family protein refolding chaperone
MKTPTKWIIASVGGIALVSTLAVAGPRFKERGPEMFADRMIDRITDNLELNEAQVAKLNGVKDTILEARKKMRENRKDKQAEMLALLGQPTLDQEKAMAMLTERGDAMKAEAPKVIGALAGFYDSLSPEQQQTLRETIQDRMERREKCGRDKPGRDKPGRDAKRERTSFQLEEGPSFGYSSEQRPPHFEGERPFMM